MLVVSAQVSLYPLRQEHLTPAIQALRSALEQRELSAEVGAMSTLVSGEAESLFEALRDGFDRAASTGSVVMTVTISNACPVDR
jgi:uncharacterized protein YqgV (UPF0045/DUF77 family)